MRSAALQTSESSGGHERRAPGQRLLLAAFAVLLVTPIWLFDRLPMQDLPNHLAIVATLAAEGSVAGWHEVFENRLALAPYSGYYWATLSASRVLGVERANRLVLTLYLLASIWAFSALVASGRGSPLATLLVLPLLYNDFYQVGMASFLISLPFLIGAVAIARRLSDSTRPMLWGFALALCSLALVLAHPFSWILGSLLILLSLRGLKPRAIGGASLVPAAAVLLSALDSRSALSSPPIWLEPAFKLHYLISSPAMVAEAANQSFFWLGIGLWLALLIAAAARSWRAGRALTPRSTWILVAGLALAYFAAPFSLGAAVWLDGRIALVLWGALLFALAPCLLRTRSEILAAVLANLLLFGAVLQGHRAFDDEIAPLAEVIEAMPPNARVLWLPFDRSSQALEPFYQRSGQVPYFTLYAHAGAYYHVKKGGLSPSMTFHASLPWIPLGLKDELFRRAFTVADPFAPEDLVANRTRLLGAFDFLLVRGLRGKGLEPVAEPLLWVEDFALFRPRSLGLTPAVKPRAGSSQPDRSIE